MREIYIYSPKSQLFGLLSNNAVTPFNLNGQTWSSVTEYVFVNFETNIDDKRKKLYRNPYTVAMTLKNERDTQIFNQALIFASSVKLKQYPAVFNKLLETRKRDLYFEDHHFHSPDLIKQLVHLYNSIRYNPNVYFDPARGEILTAAVSDTIFGLHAELKKNPDLSDMTFENAIRFAAKAPSTNIPIEISDLDHLVSDLKRAYGKDIYANEINNFKQHLLDTYLNYILQTEYPNISKDQYGLAKAQQRSKETHLLTYENQLFDLYVSENTPAEIVSRLVTIPKREHIDAYVGKLNVNMPYNVDTKSDALMMDKYTILKSDPLSLDFPLSVTIDNIAFKTIFHYAYWILFKNIGDLNANINDVDSVQDVKKLYTSHNDEYVVNKLTTLNELATKAKLEKYADLTQLLIETGNDVLIWGDKTDQVLGIGNNNTGGNRAGEYLMFHRGTIATPSKAKIDGYPSSESSLIIKWYLSNLAEDYANTLKLLKQPPTGQDLIKIYGIQPIDERKFTEPSNYDKFILNSSGLNAEATALVWPFILTVILPLGNLSDGDCIKTILNFYDESEPTKDDRLVAVNKLKGIYANVNAAVERYTFISSILAGKPTENKLEWIWWRIHYWAKQR